MDFDENIERVYYSTIKFSSNNEHSEIQVLQMLEEAGYTKKTWGINTSGRGKYVEVKFNNKRDCDSLIVTVEFLTANLMKHILWNRLLRQIRRK